MEAKMQKSYSVTNATGASARNSEGLAIEANDVGYFVEVQIGSSDTKFKMLVDSGSVSYTHLTLPTKRIV